DGVSASVLTLGQLVIDKNLSIEGQSNPFAATGVGGIGSRAFDVIGNVNVTFANVVINGFADHGGGGLKGGGALALANCSLKGTAVVSGTSGRAGNVAGGALYNAAGTVSLSNCQIVGQAIAYASSSALGGGVYNAAGATLLVTNCTFSLPGGYE